MSTPENVGVMTPEEEAEYRIVDGQRAGVASLRAAGEPVLRIYAEGSMRTVTEWLDGAVDLPDGDYDLYAAPQASAEVRPLSQYSYQTLFDAISAATKTTAGGEIEISVQAFRDALKSAPAVKQTAADDCIPDSVEHYGLIDERVGAPAAVGSSDEPDCPPEIWRDDPPAKSAGDEIKTAYIRVFGNESGWLSFRGSWFVEGYRTGKADHQQRGGDVDIKSVYTQSFGSDAGWYGSAGSYFIEGYRAALADKPAVSKPAPNDEQLIALALEIVPDATDEQAEMYGHLWVRLCRMALARYGYGLAAQPAVSAEPVAWIERSQLEALRDEGNDAWVYDREPGHVAEPDEVPLYSGPVAAHKPDGGDAKDADPLQGAADWLVAALAKPRPTEIAARLLIGYNRAERLYDAAISAQQRRGEAQ